MRKIAIVFSAFLFFLLASQVPLASSAEPNSHSTVLFSPQDHLADRLIDLIQKEKKSIRVAVYCFMHHGIGKALIEAHKRGVSVEVIVDPYSVNFRSPLKKMMEAHVPVYIWNPQDLSPESKSKSSAIMHDKFCIFSGKLVWTGSFNFTYKASNRNCENVIVFEDEAIAKRYLVEFKHLKKMCTDYVTYVSQK